MFNKGKQIYINTTRVYFYQLTTNKIIAGQCLLEWDA